MKSWSLLYSIVLLSSEYICGSKECGVANDNDERIVGGIEASPHEFPWQVALIQGRGGDPYCGGAVLNDLYVLTAAHCAQPDITNVYALLGAHNTKEEKKEAYRIKAKRLLPHPAYDKESFVNDIGLVVLKKRIKFGKNVRPACLPPPGFDYEGEMAVVSGWGVQEENSKKMSDTLQKVEVPITSWRACVKFFDGEREIRDSVICAHWRKGKKDACAGDSGGPLVWESEGRFYDIGIVSWGKGCARPNSPAVYTRVDKYYDWLDRNTHGAATCTE